MTVLIGLIIVAALVTLGILLAGVFTMARGGEVTARKSNRLMRMRVIAQAGTLLLIVLFVAIMAGG
ncbi:MAG: twin transmembrane helix small protein [Pseudomonadota bacterium]